MAPDPNIAQVASVVENDATINSEKERIGVTNNGTIVDHGLHRALKQRHLQMIALGGVIGASIWYGTGVAISYSGPIGALICFIVIGIDVFFVMQSLGELATLYPTTGAFTEMAGRFIDPAVAVALGYNYWYLWAANIAAEYNLISILMQYWTDKVPTYAWILISWAFYQVISLFGVMVYGELEYWLSLFKIICVVVTYLLAILVNTGAIGGDYIGFRYWRDPGPIRNGINGFGKSFVLSAVYYSGSELVAITAGESRRPHKDVPKAIRQTLFRIVLIYWLMIFFAGISAASNDPGILSPTSNTGSSPFSLALQHAGWTHGPDLINAFIFFATFSATNSSVYIASRTLYSLADSGKAPRFLLKTPFLGVPIYCVIISNAVGLLALINVASGAGQVFSYIISLCGTAAFIAWSCIGIIHLRFRRAWKLQGRAPEELPFRAFLFPYGAYFVVSLNLFLLFIQGYTTLLTPFKPVDFVFAYITIALFVVLFTGWKIVKRTKFVNLREVDLQYGQRLFLASAEDDEESPSTFTKATQAIRNRFKKSA